MKCIEITHVKYIWYNTQLSNEISVIWQSWLYFQLLVPQPNKLPVLLAQLQCVVFLWYGELPCMLQILAFDKFDVLFREVYSVVAGWFLDAEDVAIALALDILPETPTKR